MNNGPSRAPDLHVGNQPFVDPRHRNCVHRNHRGRARGRLDTVMQSAPNLERGPVVPSASESGEIS